MATRQEKYRQAAITYLVYGLLYLTGAVYLAAVDVVARSGWIWFAVGLVFVTGLPPLIWYEFTWITRLLSILVFVRVVGLTRTIWTDEGQTVPLPWDSTLPMRYGALAFLIVAAITCVMLVRAGWNVGAEKESTSAS